MGEPDAGDLNGIYPNNPVEIKAGLYTDLPDLVLTPVDASARAERLAEGKFNVTPTWFSGRVVNQDGRPVPDIYVFAYLDSRMVGKPTYISAATNDQGFYRLNLGTGGTYYLGARSTFGGPLEPGEWVGTFDARADHSVQIEERRNLALDDIVQMGISTAKMVYGKRRPNDGNDSDGTPDGGNVEVLNEIYKLKLMMGTSARKGAVCETVVFDNICRLFPYAEVEHVGKTAGRGDISNLADLAWAPG